MVKLNFLLATAAYLAIAVNTADASFGMCFGHRLKASSSNVYGYYLWNDAGDNSHSYGSFAPNTATAWLGGQNDWNVEVMRHPRTGRLKVAVASNKYSFKSTVNMEPLCYKEYPSGDRSHVYYACYSSDYGWCKQERDGMIAACKLHVEMGADSVDCK